MLQTLRKNFNQDVKQIKRKYKLLKIKYFLLFVLPILIIVVAYQVVKQYLKLQLQNLNKNQKKEPTPARRILPTKLTTPNKTKQQGL